MSEELKPCPFCGQRAIPVGRNAIGCVGCHVAMEGNSEYGFGGDGWIPVERWNTRPIEDELRKENEMLKNLVLDIWDEGLPQTEETDKLLDRVLEEKQ